VLGALGLASCGPTDEELDPDDSITVGLLLPFTGSSAATASNFEKAVLMAAEWVNDAGGIQGKWLRVVARDTFSDAEEARASLDALLDEGAVAVVGPESPEIADALRGALDEAEVPLLSPLVGEGQEVELDCSLPWYRLAPSARAQGENLANLLSREGYSKVAILSGAGEYDAAFSRAVREKFESNLLGGTVVVERELDPAASSYTEEIVEALEAEPELIVLSASPQTGAVVFTEATLLEQSDVGWALSPLLKTPLFLQNINAETAEGAIGVSPKIFDTSEDFPDAFAERWRGDEPLEGAYFYFDALNLLAVAFGLLDDVTDFTHDDLTEAIVQASSSRGVGVGWDEIEDGLRQMEKGVDVHYSGLTGPILLETCGERRSGTTQAWVVSDGQFEVMNP
jgi:branched-chain amino acid transport system substrate-binding protein